LVAPEGKNAVGINLWPVFPIVARQTGSLLYDANENVKHGNTSKARDLAWESWGSIQPCLYNALVANTLETNMNRGATDPVTAGIERARYRTDIERLASVLYNTASILDATGEHQDAIIMRQWTYVIVPWLSKDEVDYVFAK
jgi:hypothetical protein